MAWTSPAYAAEGRWNMTGKSAAELYLEADRAIEEASKDEREADHGDHEAGP